MSTNSNEIKSITLTKEIMRNAGIQNNDTPSQFIDKCWTYYKDNYPNNNSLNGNIFENLIIVSLAKSGIENIYYQTELNFVPSAIFDVFLFNEEAPVAISIKTTLRERWKQADLEALAIKQVHKQSLCYVLTVSNKEVATRRKNDKTYNGLDGFVLANTNEFDDFINNLKQQNYTIAGSIPIIKTDDHIYTKDKLKEDFDLNI